MKRLFLDCETTGLPPKGAKYDKDYESFPHIVQLSWKVVHSDDSSHHTTIIIKPDGYIIPDDSIKIHGITNEIANVKGVSYQDALKKLMRTINGFNDIPFVDKIIAHNIYFDTSMIKANGLRSSRYGLNELNNAFHKDKRICTMMKTVKFCGCRKENGSGKFPSLQDLHKKLFGCEFENAHNAKYDVLALEKCYNELVRIGHLIE